MNQAKISEWNEKLRSSIRNKARDTVDVLKSIIAEADSENLLEESCLYRNILAVILVKRGDIAEAHSLLDSLKRISSTSIGGLNNDTVVAVMNNILKMLNNKHASVDDILTNMRVYYYIYNDISDMLLKLSNAFAQQEDIEMALYTWKCYVYSVRSLVSLLYLGIYVNEFNCINMIIPNWLIDAFPSLKHEYRKRIINIVLDVADLVDEYSESLALTDQSTILLKNIEKELERSKQRRKKEKVARLINHMETRSAYWTERLRGLHGEDNGG